MDQQANKKRPGDDINRFPNKRHAGGHQHSVGLWSAQAIIYEGKNWLMGGSRPLQESHGSSGEDTELKKELAKAQEKIKDLEAQLEATKHEGELNGARKEKENLMAQVEATRLLVNATKENKDLKKQLEAFKRNESEPSATTLQVTHIERGELVAERSEISMLTEQLDALKKQLGQAEYSPTLRIGTPSRLAAVPGHSSVFPVGSRQLTPFQDQSRQSATNQDNFPAFVTRLVDGELPTSQPILDTTVIEKLQAMHMIWRPLAKSVKATHTDYLTQCFPSKQCCDRRLHASTSHYFLKDKAPSPDHSCYECTSACIPCVSIQGDFIELRPLAECVREPVATPDQLGYYVREEGWVFPRSDRNKWERGATKRVIEDS